MSSPDALHTTLGFGDELTEFSGVALSLPNCPEIT